MRPAVRRKRAFRAGTIAASPRDMLRSPLALVVALSFVPLAACATEARTGGAGPDAPGVDEGAEANVSQEEIDILRSSDGEPTEAASDPTLVCPTGATVDPTSRLCVDGAGNAVGPFPPGMVDACKAAGGGAVCSTDRWPVGLASKAREAGTVADPHDVDDDGRALCPAGTAIDLRSGICTDGTFVYGPFFPFEIEHCKAVGGGAACGQSRFPIAHTVDIQALLEGERLAALAALNGGDLATKAVQKVSDSCGKAAELHNKYKDNYAQIKRDGDRFGRKVGTTMLCATYASKAMQRIDPSFPLRPRVDRVDNDGKVTKDPGFREALVDRQWTTVPRDKCQPGDFAFTTEGGEYGSKSKPKNPKVTAANPTAAHSAHVFMITDRAGGTFTSIDNRGFGYDRKSGQLDVAYCMRAPGVTQGCNDFVCTGKADGNYCGLVGSVYNVITCTGETRKATFQCATNKRCTKGANAPAGDLAKAAEATCK